MKESDRKAVDRFENQTVEISTIALNPDLFRKHWERVAEYFDYNLKFCSGLIRKNQLDSALYVLNQLQSLSIDILKQYPRELDPTGSINAFFQIPFKDNVKKTKFELEVMKKLLKTFSGVQDIMVSKKSLCMHYYVVFEYFIQVTHNLSYLCVVSNKVEKGYFFLLTALRCISLTEYASYYLKFHLSSMGLNLTFMLEENNKLEANAILAHTILGLENLEISLDKQKNNKVVFEFINQRVGNFATLLRDPSEDSEDIKYSTKYHFLRRLATCYEFYGKLLDQSGKPDDAKFARDQAESLHKEILTTLETQEKIMTEPKEYESQNSMASTYKSQKFLGDSITGQSFKSASNGFSMAASSIATPNSNISREDVLLQKYVEVNKIKFKIVMINLKDIKALEVIMFNKPRSVLKKLFIQFTEVLSYAKTNKMSMNDDKDIEKILTNFRIAKLLYFREGELYIKELPFFKTLDQISQLPL